MIAAKHQSAGPENCRLNGDRKSHYVRKIKHVQIVTIWDRMDFLHEVQFSAAIEAAHFPAAFGMLLSQHPKEGAPFLGTALAEYKQSIEPAVSCHFHLLIKRLLGQTGYSAKLFSTSRIEVFFSSVVLAHRKMCAAKGCMQMGRLAYTDADNTMQHRA